MSNALKDLFQEQADAIREGLGNIGGIAPNETPALIREIVSMIGTGGGGGGAGSGLKFATGTFNTKTTGIYRQTITHGLGVMPDFVMVYVDAPLVPSTTAEVIEKLPVQCAWGLHSKFASKAGVAGYYNIIGSAPDNNTAFLDVKDRDMQIYCPDDATFEFGMPSGTNGLLYEDMPYSWIAISGMATGGGSSADVHYVTFMNGNVEIGKKPVADGDDCRYIFADPTKASDAQYTYAFANAWSATDGGEADANILKNITEDKTVYAVYSKTLRYYTITYYDEDGTTVLKTESLAYGARPSYAPEKLGYVLDKWTPTPTDVTGDASYTASWASVTVSGTCGTNATYSISSNGVLTITGSGKMDDYSSSVLAPWGNYKDVITKVVVADGITHIGKYSFYGYTNLASVTIPNSVTTIGMWSFRGCTSLASVNIPNGVTKIDSSTFAKCKSLTSVTIPNGVTEIENAAFDGCSGLTSITIPNSVTTIFSSAFSECSGLTSITIGESVTTIYESAFAYCKNVTSIVIPASVALISARAFNSCTSLASATFNNPDGWFVATNSTATSGTNLNLTDTARNATYLTNTYKTYYWRRK